MQTDFVSSSDDGISARWHGTIAQTSYTHMEQLPHCDSAVRLGQKSSVWTFGTIQTNEGEVSRMCAEYVSPTPYAGTELDWRRSVAHSQWTSIRMMATRERDKGELSAVWIACVVYMWWRLLKYYIKINVFECAVGWKTSVDRLFAKSLIRFCFHCIFVLALIENHGAHCFCIVCALAGAALI